MFTIFSVAWRNLFRHGRRTAITAVAMGIGVAACLAMFAFTDGMMGTMFSVMIDQQLGHVQVHHPDFPGRRAMHDTITEADARLAQLDGLEPRATSARLYGYGLVGGDEKSEGGQLVGVFPQREHGFTKLPENMLTGRYLSDEPAREVILGWGLAKKLDLEVGGELLAVTQAADGSMGNNLYEIVGTFRSGDAMIDKQGAYLHIADLQSLLVLEDQVHEILLLADRTDQVADLSARAQSALGVVDSEALLVRTWAQASPQTAQMMSGVDIQMGISTFIILGLASFGVLNTMLMSVFERTRELGVMKAVGMRPRQIVGLVLAESVLLGGLACTAGLMMGGVIDWYLITHGMDFSVDGKALDFMGVAFEPVIRGEFRLGRVWLTVGLVGVVSVLAALWPAVRAARLRPVDAIRDY